jgi:Xaa-Pro aminopeptidase
MTIQQNTPPAIPFNASRLDALLDAAGIDVLVANSKHNISYLLGGYRFFFFDAMDAIGISRYLPLVVYVKGRADATTYVANPMEAYERAHGQFWMPDVRARCWGVADAVALAIAAIEASGLPKPRIGIETSFLPADAWKQLADRFGEDHLVDALYPLERLRAVKTPAELALLREASEKVIDAMGRVIATAAPGVTTRELAQNLKLEETRRGLNFEYCLVTSGTGFNRAPSGQTWNMGEIASLDSGGNYRGYIGDVCRMAVMGQPDQELQDLLGEIEEVQQAARVPVRAGTLGRAVIEAGEERLANSAHRAYTTYVAHGMGLISHEAPRLTSNAPVPYDGVDGDLPLEEGMVLSIETTMSHPRRGFIKLEDTVAVTRDGWECYGDTLRGWNVAG